MAQESLPGTQLVNPTDDLAGRFTSDEAIEMISAAMRANAFEFTEADQMLIATATTLQVEFQGNPEERDEYTQGYQLLEELAALDKRITKHYEPFDRPIGALTAVVRGLRIPQTKEVIPVRQALSRRLGTWKALADEHDRQATIARQAALDLAAREAQMSKAATLNRIADAEPDPRLRESFQQEAAAVASVNVQAAPVQPVQTAPPVAGHNKATWKCKFENVTELLKAHVEGRCHLDEDAIMKGLQSFMDTQATAHEKNLSKAFPGCVAVPTYNAVSTPGRGARGR